MLIFWVLLLESRVGLLRADSLSIVGLVAYVEQDSLWLGCSYNKSNELVFDWILPENGSAKLEHRVGKDVKFGILSIVSLKLSDMGQYTCSIQNRTNPRSSVDVKIFGKQEYPAQPDVLDDPSQTYMLGEELTLVCYTEPLRDYFLLRWLLPASSHAVSENRTAESTLMHAKRIEHRLLVRNLTDTDRGYYNCEKTNRINGLKSYRRKALFLANVFGTPGTPLIVRCAVSELFYTSLTWFYSACKWNRTYEFPKQEDCSDWGDMPIGSYAYYEGETLTFLPTSAGRIRCQVKIGSDTFVSTANLYVQEQPKAMAIESQPMGSAFSGNTTIIRCFASMYLFTESMELYHDKNSAHSGRIFLVQNTVPSNTKYMYGITLKVDYVTLRDAGRYICVAKTFDSDIRRALLDVVVFDSPRFPTPNGGMSVNETENHLVDANSEIVLECAAIGFPVPVVNWFKNDVLVESSISLFVNATHLIIDRLIDEDCATYECRAENRFGVATKYFNVHINHPGFSTRTNTIIVLGIFVVLICIALVSCVCYRRDHKKRLAKHNSSAAYFIVGEEYRMKNDLSLTEQVDVLSYDTRYDFKKDNLSLGDQLGCGAFGQVLQAEATGILRTEPTTTVAVKRVKNTANSDDIKALISELKIMIYLGKHLNVLKLLGVVHEDLNKGELLVITEFCLFGNLRDYVRRNRGLFVDELNSKSGDSSKVMSTENAESAENFDPKESTKNAKSIRAGTITTTDLICWSYQVAQGMNFLARRGVLHGDLAARNILLADDNVVKISDFGFSRPLRFNEDYTKNTEMAMPLKWMAIESIERNIFNSSSDVWAFGVLMWELFSLCDEPYRNISAIDLLAKLRSGFRLEQPRFASVQVYHVMRDCWTAAPLNRPRFSKIYERLATFCSAQILRMFHDNTAVYVDVNVAVEDKSYGLHGEVSNPDYPAPICPDGDSIEIATMNSNNL